MNLIKILLTTYITSMQIIQSWQFHSVMNISHILHLLAPLDGCYSGKSWQSKQMGLTVDQEHPQCIMYITHVCRP